MISNFRGKSLQADWNKLNGRVYDCAVVTPNGCREFTDYNSYTEYIY